MLPHISVRMFKRVYYLYHTGLKKGIQRLGALRSSERWAEGAQTAALTDKFWYRSKKVGQEDGREGICKIGDGLSRYRFWKQK